MTKYVKRRKCRTTNSAPKPCFKLLFGLLRRSPPRAFFALFVVFFDQKNSNNVLDGPGHFLQYARSDSLQLDTHLLARMRCSPSPSSFSSYNHILRSNDFVVEQIVVGVINNINSSMTEDMIYIILLIVVLVALASLVLSVCQEDTTTI